LIGFPNCVSCGKTGQTVDILLTLSFIKKSQVTQVQSSMKETDRLLLEIVAGHQNIRLNKIKRGITFIRIGKESGMMVLLTNWETSKWKDTTTHWTIKTKSLISNSVKGRNPRCLFQSQTRAPRVFQSLSCSLCFFLVLHQFISFSSLITVMLKSHTHHPPQSQKPLMESSSSPWFVSAALSPHPTKFFLFSSLHFLSSYFLSIATCQRLRISMRETSGFN